MKFQQWVETIESIVTTVAILVGGLWAYLAYFRNRLSVPHLALKISAQVVLSKGKAYLHTVVSCVNRGGAVVRIDGAETCVVLYALSPRDSGDIWADVDADRVLVGLDLIEPNEDVVDENLTPLPVTPEVPVRVVFHLKAKSALWGLGRTSRWEASTIAFPSSKPDPIGGNDGAHIVDRVEAAETGNERSTG